MTILYHYVTTFNDLNQYGSNNSCYTISMGVLRAQMVGPIYSQRRPAFDRSWLLERLNGSDDPIEVPMSE